jgi:hypothetical protein
LIYKFVKLHLRLHRNGAAPLGRAIVLLLIHGNYGLDLSCTLHGGRTVDVLYAFLGQALSQHQLLLELLHRAGAAGVRLWRLQLRSLHVFVELPLTCICEKGVEVMVREALLALRKDLALLPLEEALLDLESGHLLAWSLMLALLVPLHNQLRRQVPRSLIDAFEYLRLFLRQLAL